MFNNVHRASITVSLTGGGDAVHVLYDYPPLHHLITACGRTEVVFPSSNNELKVMSDEEVGFNLSVQPLTADMATPHQVYQHFMKFTENQKRSIHSPDERTMLWNKWQ